MNGDQPGIPDQLRIKFPHLQPVKRPPVLVSVNGIGLSIYGRRDVDEETQTYVKTHVITLVFIPIWALGAYRVADAAPRRWYFLGKESLSSFARTGNMVMACLLVCLTLAISWNVHTSSPEYRAQQEIHRAAALLQAGEAFKAAGIYRRQLDGPAAAAARSGLQQAIETSLKSDQPQTIATALRLLGSLPASVNQPAPLVTNAFNRGLELSKKYAETDLEGALAILNAAAVLAPNDPAVPPLQIGLLQQLVAAKPDDTNRVVELAVAYENNDQLDQSWKLLRPYQDRLGATEGARILGQKLLAEQNYSAAYRLLFPYVQARLESLHSIETSYSRTVAAVSRQAIDDLNDGKGGADFYAKYKAAAKPEQEILVDDFIEQRMKVNPAFQQALAKLKEANRIVPVTLDLGIVQLNRAQGLTDAAARKAELEAAEKTFLAIRSFAGKSDEYRLFLGQVYYWLGKSQEGRELFDQLLAAQKRNYTTLMAISETLRSVGESREARALVEEAYKAAPSDKQKYAAAGKRSLLCKDEDDRIEWLQKADPNSTWIQIELNAAHGHKAMQQGNKALAANYFSKASSGYSTQTKTSASLNNWALVCFNLYEATGNIEDQKHGVALLEEAVAMDPSDSILLHNTTYWLIRQAVENVNHGTINLAALGEQPGLHLLSFLYHDESGRAQVYRQLRDDETMKKALGYLDKALLLAPKNLDLYATASGVYGGYRDVSELQKIRQRFQIAAPDLTETCQETLAEYTGKKDKEQLEKIQQRIQLLRADATNATVAGNVLTLEYVNVALNRSLQNAWVYGGDVDGLELLRQAQSTYQRHASSASHSALKSAYFFRANEELARQSPDYARLVAQTRHAIAPEYLVAFVLEQNTPLAALIRKNESVARAIAMEQEDLASYPASASIAAWALLRTSAPEAATKLADRYRQEVCSSRLVDELQFQACPVNASLVLEQYWMQKMLGDDKRAIAIYQQATHDGVPLPAL